MPAKQPLSSRLWKKMLPLSVRRWDLLSRLLIFRGELVFTFCWRHRLIWIGRYKLNICKSNFALFRHSENLIWDIIRGRRRSKDTSLILEELFWEDGCSDLGGGCDWSSSNWWLSRGIGWFVVRGGRFLFSASHLIFELLILIPMLFGYIIGLLTNLLTAFDGCEFAHIFE